MLTIIAGVVCVGIRPGQIEGEVDYWDLILSIFFALLTGFLYTLHLFNAKYC